MNKRFWAALALSAALIALAFYLPPQLSRWDDRKIMDEPQITKGEEREGLADSLRLTVAEKLLLMHDGSLSYLSLPGGEAKVRYTIENDTGGVYISSEPEVKAPAADDEEWSARLAGVRREMLALQRAGALPELWEEDIQAELSGSGEILCIDKNTQVSFLIWQMTLSFPDWNVGITVDSHTGKLLSLSLRWLRGEPPSWGATGTVGFGSAWREYWGMDSVDANWYTPRINEILSSPMTYTGNNDYSMAGEITFTYDGQTLRVPIYSWCSGGSCAVQWKT